VLHAGELDADDVGGLTRYQRADLGGEAKRARAVDRGHREDLRRRQCGCAAGDLFPEQRRRLQLGPEIEAIVAGSSVGSERDVDAGCGQRSDWAEPARELEVRAGAVHDARRCRGELLDLVG
jgi:hypothetical protein